MLVAVNMFRVHRWQQNKIAELLNFAGAVIIEPVKLGAEGVYHCGGVTGHKQQMNRK